MTSSRRGPGGRAEALPHNRPAAPRGARLAAALLVLAGLISAVVWMQVSRERRFPDAEPAEEVLYVPSPAVLGRLALSYDAILADVYWIRTIQYYGSRRLSKAPAKRYDLLYPLLDLTTSLDPYFSIAYRFGAYFLSEQAPGGAGRADQAVALLEKAMRVSPDRWEYPHDIAFVYYRLGDYKRAGEWFQRAADVPNAANWLGPMAAVTLAKGGDRETSRMIFRRLYATADEKWLKESAAWRLRQLDALDAIDELQRLTVEYERRHGRPPADWQAVIRSGLIPGLPVDPSGVPYVLNSVWGTVTVSPRSSLWPLPVETAGP